MPRHTAQGLAQRARMVIAALVGADFAIANGADFGSNQSVGC
jgi:hypothetical protein